MPSDTLPLPSPAARPFAAAGWAAALAAAAFGLYARTGNYGFIYLDDQVYVASNPYVHHGLSWAGLRWAATANVVDNWHPLTLLVELVLSSLFGASAATFHLANAVLHGLTTGLLFAFLRLATGRTGAAAATTALWGLHPLRVESVAWIAELKDELSGVFWVGCLLAYAAYGRRRTARRYAAVAGLLALALLSKPTAVSLPVVLLLSDYWPLGGTDRSGRWWRARLLEKVPLAGLAVADAAVRILTQSSRSALLAMPWTVRAANALVSVVAYLRQTVWPTGLGLFYPHPWLLRHPIPTAAVAASAALLIAITAAVVIFARRRPYLPVGWFWFLVAVLPMLGLLQAGDQARADRYTYLPGMGLTIAAVYLVADAVPPRVGMALAGAATLAVAAATVALTPTWASSRSVWARADAVIPDNYVAAAFLSAWALHDGDAPGAERLARRAVGLVPGTVSDGHLALAEALDAERRPAAARPEFDAAVHIAGSDPLLRYKFGLFLDHQGDATAACVQLDRAVRLDPSLTAARLALADALAHDHRTAAAADQYRRVLAIDPADDAARRGLAANVP